MERLSTQPKNAEDHIAKGPVSRHVVEKWKSQSCESSLQTPHTIKQIQTQTLLLWGHWTTLPPNQKETWNGHKKAVCSETLQYSQEQVNETHLWKQKVEAARRKCDLKQAYFICLQVCFLHIKSTKVKVLKANICAVISARPIKERTSTQLGFLGSWWFALWSGWPCADPPDSVMRLKTNKKNLVKNGSVSQKWEVHSQNTKTTLQPNSVSFILKICAYSALLCGNMGWKYCFLFCLVSANTTEWSVLSDQRGWSKSHILPMYGLFVHYWSIDVISLEL